MTIREQLIELMRRATALALNKPFAKTLLDPDYDQSKQADFIVEEREFKINQQIYDDTFDRLADEFGSRKDYNSLMSFYQESLEQCNNIATLKRVELFMGEKELPAYYRQLNREKESFESIQEEFLTYLDKNEN